MAPLWTTVHMGSCSAVTVPPVVQRPLVNVQCGRRGKRSLQVACLGGGMWSCRDETSNLLARAALGAVFQPCAVSRAVRTNKRRSVITFCTGSGGGDSGNTGGKKLGGGEGDNEPAKESDDDRILSLLEVQALAAAKNAKLPADMLDTAAKMGLRSSALEKFFAMKDLPFTGFAMNNVPWIRDRLIADDKFLFKVVAEVLIDTGCATVAEVRKRGDDFWKEFEFYMSDMVVGIVLDVALVSLMAPVAVIGSLSRSQQATGKLQKWIASVPSAVFEASIPGVREYSLGQRVACIGVKFCEYSLAGMACGFLGQGFANSLMMLRRHVQGESEGDVAVPPLVQTALVWGLFMGVSSNLRYQAVFGLERAVDLTIAKSVPQVAYGTTIAIRFINNVIGGENFIDMARYFGVQ